jgi:hypothetical protein
MAVLTSLRNFVSWKLFQSRRHVLDRGRTILRTDGPVCMAGDVIRHSLAYPNPVGDLLERVTPSVVWLQLPVSNSKLSDPIAKPLPNLD